VPPSNVATPSSPGNDKPKKRTNRKKERKKNVARIVGNMLATENKRNQKFTHSTNLGVEIIEIKLLTVRIERKNNQGKRCRTDRDMVKICVGSLNLVCQNRKH
jgi:hypothetical protein